MGTVLTVSVAPPDRVVLQASRATGWGSTRACAARRASARSTCGGAACAATAARRRPARAAPTPRTSRPTSACPVRTLTALCLSGPLPPPAALRHSPLLVSAARSHRYGRQGAALADEDDYGDASYGDGDTGTAESLLHPSIYLFIFTYNTARVYLYFLRSSRLSWYSKRNEKESQNGKIGIYLVNRMRND